MTICKTSLARAMVGQRKPAIKPKPKTKYGSKLQKVLKKKKKLFFAGAISNSGDALSSRKKPLKPTLEKNSKIVGVKRIRKLIAKIF